MTGRLGEGTIKIDGDATKFKKSVKDVKDGLEDIEKGGEAVGESFVTLANNSFALFERVAGYAKGLYDHIKNASEAAAMTDRKNIALTMLKRYNREYYDITKNIESYTNGLMKSEDAIFLINKAVHRNIGLTKSQLEEVLKMSSKVAVSIGTEIGEVFDKISESVGKFETAPLEELGIIIDLEEAVKKYAAAQGKTADEIDNLTKKEIVLAETRKRIKEGLTGTFSDKEFDIKMELNKTLSILDKSFRESGEQYNKFWAKQVKTINDFAMQEANIVKIRYAKEREILKDHLKGQYKSWDEYQESQAKRTEIWNDGQVRIMTTYSQEYYQSLAKIKNAVDDFKKSMESKAAFNNFYVGLQELKHEIKPITDQFNKLKDSIWFLKDEPVKPKKIVDKAAIEAEWNNQFEIAKSYYDKLFEMEFEDYKNKEDWEKAKLEQIKIFRKLDIGELKAYSKEADKTLFNEAKDKKREERDQALRTELRALEIEYNTILNDMASNIRSFNNELFSGIYTDVMASTKAGYVENAQTLDSLTLAYQNELERFKQYARDKKLTAEELAMGMEAIQKRANDKAYSLDQKHYDMEGDLKKEAASFALNTANALYSAMLSDQENAVQAAFANAMLQAGAGVYAAGVENVWVGFGKLFSILTAAEGAKQMGGGALQIAGAAAIGFVGKAALPTGGGEKTARVENQIEQKNRDIDQKTEVYLFKSEREWVQKVKDASKKF